MPTPPVVEVDSLRKELHYDFVDLEVGGTRVQTRLADTQQKRYVGLSNTEKLGETEGMLFEYPEEKRHRLVMRDMDFPLDVIHVGADGRVTKWGSMTEVGEAVEGVSKYAIELPHGFCEDHGVAKGDPVRLLDPPDETEKLFKERRYVDDPSEVPEGIEPQQGPQGGLYYETDTVTAQPTTADGEVVLDRLHEVGQGEYEAAAEVCTDAIEAGASVQEVAAAIARKGNVSSRKVARETVRNITSIDLDGFENEGYMLLASMSEEFHDEAKEKLGEKFDDGTLETGFELKQGWVGPVFDERTAPLFQVAASMTGNETLPSNVEEILEAETTDEEREAVANLREHTVEMMRDIYGDTVTVYRGLSPGENTLSDAEETDVAEQIREAVARGEDIEIDHRIAESWTIDPSYAHRYAVHEDITEENERIEEPGAMLEAEMPVEQAVIASISGILNEYENEVVMAHEGPKTYTPDDVYMYEDLDDDREMAELLLSNALEAVEDRS